MILTKKQILVISLVLAGLLIGVFSIGITQNTSKAVCQQNKKICHGIPLESSCIGFENRETTLNERNTCQQIGNITSRCNRAGEEICNINEGSIGTNWSSLVEVHGQTCETWDKKYSLNLTKC